jgi:hypothetical protein
VIRVGLARHEPRFEVTQAAITKLKGSFQRRYTLRLGASGNSPAPELTMAHLERSGSGVARIDLHGGAYPVCPQPDNATALANAFDGVIQPSVCRGRVLRERAMASSSRWVHWERSDDFGKY